MSGVRRAAAVAAVGLAVNYRRVIMLMVIGILIRFGDLRGQIDPAFAAPFTAAAEASKGINNGWQIVHTLIVGVFALGILWVAKVAANSKKLIEAEKEATELRKTERDAQIGGMGARIDAEIRRIDQVFADHLEDHKRLESTLHESIEKLEKKLLRIENDVHSINLSIVRIMTILEMGGGREMERHEYND